MKKFNTKRSLSKNNVTLSDKASPDVGYFPCPVCKKMLPVEYTIKNKPYCTCNDCGVQLFVRGKNGIKEFMNLLSENGSKNDVNNVLFMLENIEKLEKKLSEIETKKPIFGRDENLEYMEAAIKKKIEEFKEKLG